jgi:5-methylcytosine-specific restriction protein A
MVDRLRGRAAVAQRKRRMQRTNGLCEMCLPDIVKPATVVDHIKPLAHGGSDEDGNTRNLCDEHHAEVTARQFGKRYRPPIGVDGRPIGGGVSKVTGVARKPRLNLRTQLVSNRKPSRG